MTITMASPKPSSENEDVLISLRRTLVRTKADFADLSHEDIRQMSREQLIAVIRLADVPLFRDRVDDHLPGLDRPTLERLAFLAQWTVQNQGY
jgi:hypothetical protein